MSTRKRRLFSVSEELLGKSEEAALTAIKIFNDPLIRFKSESFIVLMNIAWTYLLHAYYRKKGVDYRYYRMAGSRKRYDKTARGADKYWELERCLNDDQSPIDVDTANNLKFLIGLRHEIEHQMTMNLDVYLSGRYQACAVNYNKYLEELTDKKHSLTGNLSFTLQFTQISEEQISGPKPEIEIPERLRAYVAEFDAKLSHDEYNSPQYSYRLVFKRKLVNRPGQADRVVEFIDPKSDLAKSIDKEYWVQKPVEKTKYLPSEITNIMKSEGFSKMRPTPEHAALWKREDAKNPSKGYGTDVSGTWYWYESWLDFVREECRKKPKKYK